MTLDLYYYSYATVWYFHTKRQLSLFRELQENKCRSRSCLQIETFKFILILCNESSQK